ncbi:MULTISPECIES: hypothetical protein [Acidithiobacillus]|uniref:hypothetical protein n=1 Tax=Acidithiobacillus TaxID=119977 RepID=UPI001561E7E0|nr:MULTISPECIES: hypothetical protein [Acidithiobacillus]
MANISTPYTLQIKDAKTTINNIPNSDCARNIHVPDVNYGKGQQDEKTAKGQDEAATEDIAHVRERQGKIGQHRYQQGFVEEFPEIPIGLEDGRPLSALNALFHGDHEAVQER